MYVIGHVCPDNMIFKQFSGIFNLPIRDRSNKKAGMNLYDILGANPTEEICKIGCFNPGNDQFLKTKPF